ncbi:MAG: RNB domain-containing ribonuclease [Methanospirillum sp.]|uniref:RNB domain-containing ribonuclease n=1 Tax=Methanospirillum sp. TaxID=45200 RepID=UPI002372F41F|nr:RNB domain-containing ribonuclease [Methanospirillum sp.]MDD1730214.1 RNB domain-containing ribonuclease [Methanospirillum sp.]
MKKNTPIDLKSIARDVMVKYGFLPEFSPSVINEVKGIVNKPIDSHPNDIRDLRTLLWSSIDNYDSMDLDQIEYCEPGKNDIIHVKIAIADVDFFVNRDSQADRHAAHNGTSVYTGIETFPMLPDPLSKGVSSLLPGSDHLAMVIEYTVLPDGNFEPGDIYRALVTNRAKLIYEEIGDWLEGKTNIPESVRAVAGLKEQIELQNTAALRLKQHRREQGALDLGTLEANAIISEGVVLDLVVQEQNLARCLIEEFMVAANGTTVAFLNKAGMPMVQRIVRTPKNWEGIRMTAAQLREKLPRAPDTRALAKFLIKRRQADPERFPDLSLTIVKLMGPGEYVPLIPGEPPVGHFALAVTDYTHGTAPNRRYVDLIIQRIIKSVLDNRKNPYTNTELQELTTWLTGREKGSKKVERFMQKAAAAVLLQNRIGQLFEGLVTGASEKGTYVRIISPPVEGRVVQGCRGLYVGQKVRVRLLRTDPYQGYIDFDCTGKVQG